MRMSEGNGFLVVEQALVAAADDLAHGGEIVHAGDGLDLELAVVGLLHRAVFPDDHGGDGFGALDVGDVEALDAAGEFFERERVLQRFLDGLHVGLHHAEALVVGLLGVEADEVDEGALLAALRGENLHAAGGSFGQQLGKNSAVREVDRDEDGARDVVLVEVELFEQRGEEGGGGEGVVRCGLWVVSWVGEDGVLFGDGGVGRDLGRGSVGSGSRQGIAVASRRVRWSVRRSR